MNASRSLFFNTTRQSIQSYSESALPRKAKKFNDAFREYNKPIMRCHHAFVKSVRSEKPNLSDVEVNKIFFHHLEQMLELNSVNTSFKNTTKKIMSFNEFKAKKPDYFKDFRDEHKRVFPELQEVEIEDLYKKDLLAAYRKYNESQQNLTNDIGRAL